ncbi:MAG: 2-dehydropantoate 2-reductase [Firmicutes bacterium]|nr:2-dehydropantoate 2-reductase [Bacillota bacterium]
MEGKNICVVGIGGLGGYFGAKLAKAFEQSPDMNVSFVARGNHLKAIQEDGLTLMSPEFGVVNCKPAMATDKFKDLPKTDLFILAVKGYDLEETAVNLRDVVKEDTVVIPLLNGVDIYDRLKSIIKEGIILPACVYITAYIEGPGITKHEGNPGRIVFGRDKQRPDFVPEAVIDIFNKANINNVWRDDIESEIWEKFIFIASFALVTAHYNKPMGDVLNDKTMREEAVAIMNEISGLTKKKGIAIPEGIVDITLRKAAAFPYDTQSSLQRDINLKKAKNELDAIGGVIVRQGKELGLSTPVTERLYSSLKNM